MLKSSSQRFGMTMGIIIFLILCAIYISLTNGTFDITITDVFKTLFRIDPVPEHDLVIFEFRLPRIVIAGLVGLGLGVAGAVIQGITRNGLADPGILGVNAGAGTAIVIFMFFFQGQLKKHRLGFYYDDANVWFSRRIRCSYHHLSVFLEKR